MEFTSDVGRAAGIWEGTPPTLGKTYDVELDAPGQLAWGAELRPTDAAGDAIETMGEGVSVRGVLLSLDDDGTVVLSVGGSVLLLEAEGQPNPSTRLEAHLPELHLHNTNV